MPATTSTPVATMIRDFSIVLIVLLILDAIFIAIIYKQFAHMIQNIQQTDKISFRPIPAILVYPILALALYTFIIQKKDQQDVTTTLLHAAILGFTIYATYELTNLATIAKWKWRFAVVDMMWGISGFTLTTIISITVIEWLDKLVGGEEN